MGAENVQVDFSALDSLFADKGSKESAPVLSSPSGVQEKSKTSVSIPPANSETTSNFSKLDQLFSEAKGFINSLGSTEEPTSPLADLRPKPRPQEPIEKPTIDTTTEKSFSINSEDSSGRTRAPIRLTIDSVLSGVTGSQYKTYGRKDISNEAFSILQQAASKAIENKRPSSNGYIGVSYEDYKGTTNDGLSAKEAVGLAGDSKKREEVYGKGLFGILSIITKLQKDPMLEALYSLGGFSIKKNAEGDWIATDQFNFKEKQLKGSDSYSTLRNNITKAPGISTEEGSGPRWEINLGKLTNGRTEKRKKS